MPSDINNSQNIYNIRGELAQPGDTIISDGKMQTYSGTIQDNSDSNNQTSTNSSNLSSLLMGPLVVIVLIFLGLLGLIFAKKIITFFKKSEFWALVASLAAVVITIIMVNSGYSAFETRVLSLLILTYSALSTFYLISMRTTAQLVIGLDSQFIRMRKLLKDKSDEIELIEAKVNDALEKTKKSEIIFALNLLTNGLIWLIAGATLFIV